ncbi:MAG: hypothetical protein ACJ8IK_09290 [Burkholderiaceae bacterium]
MKHVYPPRHPASLDAPAKGPATVPRGNAAEPAPAHERDDSGQGAAASQQHATRGGEDTDRGRVAGAIHDDGSSHRGPDASAR